ncbi:MAG: hypothetical protein ACRCZF_19965, partial [Gemmataceae bacterium]
IVAFGYWPRRAQTLLGRFTPMTLCYVLVSLLIGATEPMVLIALVHLGTFFLVALLCAGELAAARPAPEQLTQFYRAIAVGGVMGGLFVALLAPFLFARLGPVEYPLLLAFAGFIRPAGTHAGFRLTRRDGLWLLALAVFTFSVVLGVPRLLGSPPQNDPAAELLDRVLRGGLLFGLPAALAFALVWRPTRFVLAFLLVWLIGSLDPGPQGQTLTIRRDPFGTLRVTTTDDGFRNLVHGTTLHGRQRIVEQKQPAPRMYYHQGGPLGRLFQALPDERHRRVGVVGLGCGAMAAYANPGDDWTFYEISPAVIALATDPRYFTFIQSCRGTVRIDSGDARQQLQRQLWINVK